MNEPKAGRSLPWFRVDNDVVDHPKIDALCVALGDPNAGWYVVRLWAWTMRYAARGRLADGAETALERACMWRGDAGKLWRALVETGWLDVDASGAVEVHDWEEHQGAAVAKAEKDAERKRDSRKRRGDGAETARARPRTVRGTARVTGRDGTERDGTKDNSSAPASPAPRESDALCQDFKEIIGSNYRWSGGKDGTAFASLRKDSPLEEIRARWRSGLKVPSGWLAVRTVAQLASKWNDLAKLPLDLSGDWRSRVDHSNPDFFSGVNQ